MIKFVHHPQFVTITCLNWLPFLRNDVHKEIIIEALQNRIRRNQVRVYAFVIMPNHMHLIWQLHDEIVREDFQRDFLKFTARSLLAFMMMNDDPLFHSTPVIAADRKRQIWERNSLWIDLYTEKVFLQKLKYIHNNPLQGKWRLAELPELYRYSSARFYEEGIDEFQVITHYMG